jgi:capsular polysaccharide export protein
MVADGDGGMDLSDQEIGDCIASIAALQVGGSYWGNRPSLPNAPYVLVRVRDAKARAEVLQSVSKDRAILVWADSRHGISSLPSRPITTVRGCCDPWHLLGRAVEVIADGDDELALVAAISNIPVRCVGAGPFQAVTRGEAGLLQVVRSSLLGACNYTSPFTGQSITLSEAIDLCAFWRRLIDSNRSIKAALGFASWKKPTVAPLLWSGSGDVPFVSKAPWLHEGTEVAIWRSRVSTKQVRALADKEARLVEVEDGFIRSVGLGADCVPPLSIIVDHIGIYFDPQRRSELEFLLEEADFPDELVARAKTLRRLIVESGISKYEVGRTLGLKHVGEGRKLLVIGQVEDDRSVRCGGGDIQSNRELLRRVRQNATGGLIYYRPHPDVQAGHRVGKIADEELASLADEVVQSGTISECIDGVDEVHVNTSLAGFEALLRGKPVTTYGVPFYSGWGLTRDLGAVPARRTARRSLDELVAATLLLYPRYVDPVTGLPCPPEILIDRLVNGAAGSREGGLVALRRLQGRLKRIWSATLSKLT